MTPIKIFLEEGAKMPTRAHDPDAGMDLYSMESIFIPARGSYTFDTGVHMEIPVGYAGFIKSKSGLNVNHNIITDGTIDSGYTGSIRVKLYNLGDTDQFIKHHQKIAQIVIQHVELVETRCVPSLDEFESSERGEGGFGSTGV